MAGAVKAAWGRAAYRGGMRSRTALALVLTLLACSGAPPRLAATGLYADFSTRTLASGAVPFEPRWALWSDGAEKHRFVSLPEGAQIDTSDPDHWVFPVGTKLWKEFVVDGKLAETRYEEKTANGWRFETYAWNDEGTDATAAFWGVNKVAGTSHDVPWHFDCTFCHGDPEAPLGFTAVQVAGAVEDLSRKGWLSAPLSQLEATPLPGDDAARDALGVLSANCGGCHSDQGSQADKPLRLRLKGSDRSRAETGFFTTAVSREATRTIDGRRVYVVPGDSEASLLVHRFGSRGIGAQMPPVGTTLQNEQGLATLKAFVDSLQP